MRIFPDLSDIMISPGPFPYHHIVKAFLRKVVNCTFMPEGLDQGKNLVCRIVQVSFIIEPFQAIGNSTHFCRVNPCQIIL